MIQTKLYSYDFPYFSKFITFTPGTTVSIDRDGNAFPGAGTTIYRNVTTEPVRNSMKHMKIRYLDHQMTLVVYDNGVTAYKLAWEGYATKINTQSMEINRVSDVIRIANHKFIIVGDKKLLPLTVDINRVDNTVSVDFLFGTAYPLPEDDDEYPHVDNLSNTTFALIYEKGSRVETRVGRWRGEGKGAELAVSEPFSVFDRYSFHGVAGLDENHFIIAVTGNNTVGGHYYVGACLCTITDNIVTAGDMVTLPWALSHNFFDMDNVGRSRVVMVFSSFIDGSISAVVINFNSEQNTIAFGAQRTLQSGGAIQTYGRLDIRVLNEDSFAVFYEDQMKRSLCLVLCSLTWSNDIAITNPTFVINQLHGPWDQGNYYFDICPYNHFQFYIGEYLDGRNPYVMFHVGIQLPRMFGIAQKAKNGKLTVQFGGMVKVPGSQKLTPGRAIYTDSHGQLIEGRPFGYTSGKFGVFYILNSKDNSLLSNKNVVGIAVSKKKVFMKFI